MRRIPATMATQHPDNASAPYWEPGRPFVSVYQEIGEALTCFKDLGVSEYMWDWEGKHADAAVIDRLFSDYYDYFSRTRLGRDKFLTFRIPNIWEEKGYNLLQAMTAILSSEDFARDLKFETRPLFEVILPMTEKASQLLHMQRLFEKLAEFKSKDFTSDREPNHSYLEMIPLVESVEGQLAVADLLEDYVKLHQRHFSRPPEYIRAFLACSDSALSSGFLAALLGNKLGLARLYEFAGQSGIPVYPIAGSGSLPFRGGLTPHTLDRFFMELPGVRTVSVQSAFRYDYELSDVKTAIARLEKELPTRRPLAFTAAKQNALAGIATKSAAIYKQTLAGLAKDMQPVFKAVPKRRDRRQHIGLVAYARSMGDQTLPRAITFTSAFYSIGLPPEFIGFGRTLKQLTADELAILQQAYPSLADDIKTAGYYLNLANLKQLADSNPAWRSIQDDIEAAAAILKIDFGPQTAEQLAHQKLAAAALTLRDEPATLSELIERMAVLRRSIG